MGRRKKEPESSHRENIALAAERLFIKKGIDASTMDDIAKESGYSKATLYVYFMSKENIVGYLILKSMSILHSLITTALSESGNTKEKYKRICYALVDYQERYPLYFNFALSKINVDFENGDFLPIEKTIYEVGEQINKALIEYIHAGIQEGELSPGLPVLQTVFLLWSSLAGVIQLAGNKESYILKTMHLSRQEFLESGFEKLYCLIE